MTQALWAFHTLVSHWRRHPANLATLVIGLAVATALWSGVQALNQQARSSYERAARMFGGDVPALVGVQGATFDQSVFVGLRRKGLKVSPVIEGKVRLGDKTISILGIEPLTMPKAAELARIEGVQRLTPFLTRPWQTLVAPETLADLGVAAGAQPTTDLGEALPPLVPAADLLPGVMVMDIAAAEAVLRQPKRVSRLLVEPSSVKAVEALEGIAAGELRLVSPDEEGDLARLTDSFHLNLTAFGLLSFIVGLFIVHAAMGLAFEQRLTMFRTMRAVGVAATVLVGALMVELVVLALVAGAVGMISGYAIAAALLPDVAASLDGLYGAHVPGALRLEPQWWLSGLGMALLGALAAGAVSLAKTYTMPVLQIAHRQAWRKAHEVLLARYGLLAMVGLVLALGAWVFGQGLLSGFIVIAGILIGAALLLPILLTMLLACGERVARGALSQWVFADARLALPGLSLALMAMLLALAANIGVGTMVEGFRKTFTAWLDQRLASEVYFDARANEDAERIAAWLAGRVEVSAVLPFFKAETRIGGWPVEVIGFTDHATYRDHFPMLAASASAWDEVALGQGVLVSEQLARRAGLGLGDIIEVPAVRDSWRGRIAGIFPDYGNPKGQIRLSLDVLVAHWPDVRRTGFSLRVVPGAAKPLIGDMTATFGGAIGRIVDQATIKRLSTSIFDQTFAVTAALNVLTLIVSGIALVASLLTLGTMRMEQLAPVWALGVTRRRLALLEFSKVVALAGATAVIAIPLGLALAWCLVAIVNVQAFGWRLPLHVFPGQWVFVIGLALCVAALAAVLPMIRLARTAPADLLKVFANER